MPEIPVVALPVGVAHDISRAADASLCDRAADASLNHEKLVRIIDDVSVYVADSIRRAGPVAALDCLSLACRVVGASNKDADENLCGS